MTTPVKQEKSKRYIWFFCLFSCVRIEIKDKIIFNKWFVAQYITPAVCLSSVNISLSFALVIYSFQTDLQPVIHWATNDCKREPTIIILNIGTDRSEQTVQTQIRLLLMEQSDQGLLCLLFCLHLLNTMLHCKIQLFQL